MNYFLSNLMGNGEMFNLMTCKRMSLEFIVLKTVLSIHKKTLKLLFSEQLQRFCRHYAYHWQVLGCGQEMLQLFYHAKNLFLHTQVYIGGPFLWEIPFTSW